MNSPELHHQKNFKILYQDTDGRVLHGFVKEVDADVFEIFIQEKDVIVHCSKDENGVLMCRLDGQDNLQWLDGISKKLAKRLVQYRARL